MPIAKPTFITLTALAMLVTPALAKDTKVPKAESDDAKPPCTSYQLGPDGNWEQLPCEEVGSQSSSQHRGLSKSHQDAR